MTFFAIFLFVLACILFAIGCVIGLSDGGNDATWWFRAAYACWIVCALIAAYKLAEYYDVLGITRGW